MSKYYKAEDIQELIVACTWRMTLAKERGGEGFVEYDRQVLDIEELRKRLSTLPTIEVSEDAISREWAINKQKELIELYSPHKAVEGRGQVYWQIEERKLVAKELEQAPSVITPQPKEGEWIPCSERLPEACQNVQLTCEVRPVGREPSRYICIAEWIPQFCQEALSVNWDAEATEYCEEDDEYYPLEGWYECIRNWDDYSLVGIADFAIAWKPLEEPYKGAEE